MKIVKRGECVIDEETYPAGYWVKIGKPARRHSISIQDQGPFKTVEDAREAVDGLRRFLEEELERPATEEESRTLAAMTKATDAEREKTLKRAKACPKCGRKHLAGEPCIRKFKPTRRRAKRPARAKGNL